MGALSEVAFRSGGKLAVKFDHVGERGNGAVGGKHVGRLSSFARLSSR